MTSIFILLYNISHAKTYNELPHDKYDLYSDILMKYEFYMLTLITIHPIKIELFHFDGIQSVVNKNTHQKQLNNYFAGDNENRPIYFGWMSKNKEIDYKTCVLCI